MGGKQIKTRKEAFWPKRMLAIFLAVALSISMVNFSAFAGEVLYATPVDTSTRTEAGTEESVDEELLSADDQPAPEASHDESTTTDDAVDVVEPDVIEDSTEASNTDNPSTANDEAEEGTDDTDARVTDEDARDTTSSENMLEEGLALSTLSDEGDAIDALDEPTNPDDYIGLFITDGKGKITGFSFKAGVTPTDIVIPSVIKNETITTIGASAFDGLGLTSVVIPDTVTVIEGAAFKNNPLTKGVTLSENLVSLGGSAFYGCGLTSIDIPDSVTSMGWGAFHSCKSLASVSLPNNAAFDFPSNGGCYFYACSALTSIEIPASITRIPAQSFNGCSSLETITLPEGLQVIDSGAFGGAKASYIKIPSTVTTIKDAAFSSWKNATIHLPDHLPGTIDGSPWGATGTTTVLWKEIEDSCFYFDVDTQTIIGFKPAGHGTCKHPDWHTAGADIVVPKQISVEGTFYDVLALDDFVMYANTNIETLSFETGSKITVIPEAAFQGCSELKSVDLPSGLEEIGKNAFFGCGDLTAVTLRVGLTHIGEFAFSSTGLTSIDLPDGLLTIDNRAFHTNGIQTVTIPESVTYIGNWAFHYARTVTIKGNNPALEIDPVAFNNTDTCADIYVQGYDKNTLANAPWGAQYATIHWANEDETPDVLKIEDDDGNVIWHYNYVTETLIKYKGATGTNVDVVIPKIVKYEGVTYDVKVLDGDLFAGAPKKFDTVTVEEGYVTEIPAYFLSNATVNEVILPNGITDIRSNAFANSTLSTVNLPEGLKTIGISAFEGTKLSEVEFPSTLVDIGGKAFKNCKGLDTVEFPEGLLSIQGEAFAGCGLTGEIIIPAAMKRVESTAFNTNPDLEKISVLQYRIGDLNPKSPSDVKSNQPWGATGAEVVFLGETPEASHTLTQTDDVTGRGRVIDFSTWIAAGGLNITGIWVQQDDGALIDLFGPLSQKPRQQLKFTALENATYTFYVKNAYQTKLDPTECFSYEVNVTDIGEITMDADDVSVPVSKRGQFTESDILSRANIASVDNDSTKDSSVDGTGFEFTIPAAEMARINTELVDISDEITITLEGAYQNAYDLNGDPYKTSGAYSEDPAHNHLQADGTYAYTNPTSTTIKVKLVGYRVQFDLNGGSAPEGAGSDPYADQLVGIGEKAKKPVDPVRPHYTFVGWEPEGNQGQLWDFDTVVASDMKLVAVWEDVLYDYRVKHVYLDAEGTAIGEGITVDGSGIFGSSIPYTTDKTSYQGETFIYSHADPATKTVGENESENLITVYYDIDTVGTNPDPEIPDDVPDKYQVKVSYHVINGTSTIDYVYVTLFDDRGGWAQDGSGKLAPAQIPSTSAHHGYVAAKPLWDTEPTVNLVITENTDLTATYVKGEFAYTIEYYLEGQKQNWDEKGTGLFQDQITMNQVPDKCPIGYKQEKVENIPLTITVDANQNVGRVYYVRDNSKTQETYYTVNYYQDGVKVAADSYTNTATAWINDNPAMITISGTIDARNTKYPGYVLDTAASSQVPGVNTQVKSGTVINLYYVRASFNYTVEYYFNDTLEYTSDGSANFGERILDQLASYPEQRVTYENKSYQLDRIEGRDKIIAIDEAENVVRVYYVNRSVAIDARDFRMSIDEARVHEAKTADEQFREIIERGLAEAWWTDTKEDVEIIGIKVVPSSGDGRSIDAVVGEYYVTYYAGLGEYEVSITVLATVYGEEPEEPTPPVTPPVTPPTDQGTVVPPTPVTPPANDPVEEVITPIASVMEDAARAVINPPETFIADDGTPLAAGEHPWCWVHFYMIVGLVLTVLYAAAVILRRRSFTKKLRAFEYEVLGGDGTKRPQTPPVTYPIGQGTL